MIHEQTLNTTDWTLSQFDDAINATTDREVRDALKSRRSARVVEDAHRQAEAFRKAHPNPTPAERARRKAVNACKIVLEETSWSFSPMLLLKYENRVARSVDDEFIPQYSGTALIPVILEAAAETHARFQAQVEAMRADVAHQEEAIANARAAKKMALEASGDKPLLGRVDPSGGIGKL
jgi:hypothetical protein